VRDAASTPGTLPFIRTIVSLARSFGMKTVAEGVETTSQMEAVKNAGCDILQGNLLARPLTIGNAALLLPDSGTDRRDTFESEALVGVLCH
jgi:EAL domain-containing protein (putative c-di-GMP-specific phosphodiesterase class I)